jgi:hypothetical protein
MKNKLSVLALLSFVILGCAYQVPLTREIVIDDPPNPKYNEKILVVMSAEQAQKIIKYSPQLGDTYVFKGGPTFKDLMINILGQLYKEVAYAESRDESGIRYDLAVGVSLRSHEISLNIYKGNTVKLGIDYTIYDQDGKLIKELSTNSSSLEQYKGSERIAALLIVFFNIGKMKEKAGAAWDKAALNSIAELMDNLLMIKGP